MNRKYLIFGKVIEVITIESSEGLLLQNELSVYPTAEDKAVDIQINYVESVQIKDAISRNPSVHSLQNDGFNFTMGPVTIRYWFKDGIVSKVDFSIKDSSFWMATLNKMLNIQFTNHKEAIGQWFHEFVIVPLGFLFKNRALVHSSAVMTPDGNAVLFGGTGGVGKTSLEIELCKHHDCSFLTDDISFVSNDCKIYPNLAFPKIYGYNVKGDKKTRKDIFRGKSIINKFFFWLHSLRGDQYVRRRISPKVFYGKIQNEAAQIKSYLILSKSNVNTLTIESIECKTATAMSQKVIVREYQTFIDHLVWHEFNCLVSNQTPIISEQKVLSENEKVISEALGKIENIFLVKIPLEIDHTDFKNQMVQALKEHQII